MKTSAGNVSSVKQPPPDFCADPGATLVPAEGETRPHIRATNYTAFPKNKESFDTM